MNTNGSRKVKGVQPAFVALFLCAGALTGAVASTSRTGSLITGPECTSHTLTHSAASTSASIPSGQTHTWIMVPSWLAGTWRVRSEVLLSIFDQKKQAELLSKPVKLNMPRTSVIGMQADKFGRIWHCAGVPHSQTIAVDNCVERHQLVTLVPKECTESKVVVDCVSFVTRIDRQSGELISILSEDTEATYVPIKDGLIQVTFLINDYDMRSKTLIRSKKVCTEVRVKPFRRLDYDSERGELKMSFRRFLIEHKMTDSLPDR